MKIKAVLKKTREITLERQKRGVGPPVFSNATALQHSDDRAQGTDAAQSHAVPVLEPGSLVHGIVQQ